MFSYFAYGLKISSEISLPEFISANYPKSDLTITIEGSRKISDLLPPEIIDNAASIKLNREQALIYIKGTGVFLIENGCKVKVIPDSNSQELLIRFYLVSTIMGVVLYQRNYLVLHASAVNIDGGAVAFLGVSGEGKSSTAATFVNHGYSIITDDVAPIDLSSKQLALNPGFPQLKIGASMAQALGYNYSALHEVHTSKDKRALQTQDGFDLAPVPLKRIYVLTTATELAIAPIRESEAVTELVRHSRPTTLYHSGAATHFFQCAALVKKQTIYRLNRPKDLSLLPSLIQQVQHDLSASTKFDSTKQPL
ncbi:MAG: hypothetical protein AAF298_12845 [Cyanobacteria bacterium P01_A01_bin.40]